MNIDTEIEVRKLQSNLEVFSNTLMDLAQYDSNIVVVTSDSRGSGKLGPFGQKFPLQHIEVGIAEQNLVGVAAGLASTGKIVFAVSPACFLTARALEQIKNDVAYSDNPAKLMGISGGVSYGALGSTHHSLHDFAALRAIHNIIIIAPADAYETEQTIRQVVTTNKPFYVRFGKKPMPELPSFHGDSFEIGKGRIIKGGADLTLIATGETVHPALLAAKKLEKEQSLDVAVVSMHTIKPLDYELLARLAENNKPIITIEEHSIYGGLGEACASFLLQNRYCNPFKIIAIPDEYTITGSQMQIFDHYGISEKGISEAALKLIKK